MSHNLEKINKEGSAKEYSIDITFFIPCFNEESMFLAKIQIKYKVRKIQKIHKLHEIHEIHKCRQNIENTVE